MKQESPALRRYGRIAIVGNVGRLRPLRWTGSSRAAMRELPERVKHEIGQALKKVQLGLRPVEARPLIGFGGAGVLELRSDLEGATYRAVFTIRFPSAIFVLHVFQKKATHGIQTPRRHLALIRERLQRAEQEHAQVHE